MTLEDLRRAVEVLDGQNVPREGRWIWDARGAQLIPPSTNFAFIPPYSISDLRGLTLNRIIFDEAAELYPAPMPPSQMIFDEPYESGFAKASKAWDSLRK